MTSEEALSPDVLLQLARGGENDALGRLLDMYRGYLKFLARLQIDGMVRAYTLASSDGPQRKYYKPTRAGEQILRRMNGHWDELVASLDRLSSGGSRKWKRRTGIGRG